MRSDPADPLRPRRRWAGAVLLLVAILAAALVLVLPGPDRTKSPDPTAPDPTAQNPTAQNPTAQNPTAQRDSAARALLEHLSDRLGRGPPRRVLALAAPGDRDAARQLRIIDANVRRLGITDLSMRYVAEPTGRLVRRHQAVGRSWVGVVRLGWRIDGLEAHRSRLRTTMTFVRTGPGAAFVSAREDYGAAAPLWLLSRVSVQRGRRSLVMATDPSWSRRLAGIADRAVARVNAVVPRWRGRLVVEVPPGRRLLGRVLAAPPDRYAALAALTTTVDGSARAAAPVHVFVNPAVFGSLGERAAQVVLSHEATHVATGATRSTMPTWLVEGFADYVALARLDLPVTVTAGQTLAEVRRQGPPARLPTAASFDPEDRALGSSYEAAWLACRLMADRYGESRLVAFYRAADRAGDTRPAFARVLGTDQRAFVRSWRAYLRRLA